MRAATREALTGARDALGIGVLKPVVGEQLLAAARAIDGAPALRSALADASAPASGRTALAERVFAKLDRTAVTVLGTVAAARWSSEADLVAGVEELGIRALARSVAKTRSVETDLFVLGRAIASDAQLELALNSKLGSSEQKTALVERLLAKKAAPQTIEIAKHVVTLPRGRRIAEALRASSAIVADEGDQLTATVTSATPLSTAQVDRLRTTLAARYGRPVRIDRVIDASVVGGVRVQIGDDVIDGSIASRLGALRLQLAG